MGLAAQWLVCLFGAPKIDALKNRDMDGAFAFGGRRSIPITNNQPLVGGCVRGDVWVEARGQESMWGGHRPIVWGD